MQQYEEVLKLILDSKDVTVGGGSASAIAAAMGAGLISMVARLSLGKDYGLSDETYLELANRLDSLQEELLEGSVQDAKGYGAIIDAFKLPKSTDEEKALRREAIEAAGIQGADAPLHNAKLAKEVLSIGRQLSGRSNKNAASDIDIGMDFAHAAVVGALRNVRCNLPLIKNEVTLENFDDAIREIEEGM